MIQATITNSTSTPGNKSGLFGRSTLVEAALLFVAAGVLLFLFSSRIVNIFDEGILLTGTMRTMAGQVLHRDFNYNYGPAQLYLLAGLFKLFGPSVLVERLAAASLAAGLVTSVYVLARKFCGRALALSAAAVCMLWALGLWLSMSMMYPPLCMLTLWTSWLILPVADDRAQRRRAIGAGFLAAIMFFFRYDMGVGMVGANLLAVVLMSWLQAPGSGKSPARTMTTVIGPYLAAFVITVIPAAIAYLSVAPLHDLLYDVVIYMAKYYRVGRGLPFPRLSLGRSFSECGLYLVPVILALGFWVAARWMMTRRKMEKMATPTPDWVNLLVALCVAALALSARGLVRPGASAISASVVACVLVAALLLKYRSLLNAWLRGALTITVALFVLTAISSAWIQLFYESHSIRHIHLRPLAINWILTPDRQLPAPEFRSWCHDDTPITRGFCFLLDEDHIQTVRYLGAHTRPGDYLYVGLDHHDRILMNDMVTYFAVQRLPAVKWTEFDPFIENRADIQHEMIDDLELHKPPYVVLDSEFDSTWEPNGSSVSTGVHLLDDYIAAHYVEVQRYGELTILRRRDR